MRWGGTTSENLRRRSLLAFARNNDLFYDSDFSAAPFPSSLARLPRQTARVALPAGAKFQSNLAEFQDFRYEQRYDTSSCRFRAILLFFALFLPPPPPPGIARHLRAPVLGAHLADGFSLSLSLILRLITSDLYLLLLLLSFYTTFSTDLRSRYRVPLRHRNVVRLMQILYSSGSFPMI